MNCNITNKLIDNKISNMDFEQLANYMIYLYPKCNIIYSLDNIPMSKNQQKSGSNDLINLYPPKTQKNLENSKNKKL